MIGRRLALLSALLPLLAAVPTLVALNRCTPPAPALGPETELRVTHVVTILDPTCVPLTRFVDGHHSPAPPRCESVVRVSETSFLSGAEPTSTTFLSGTGAVLAWTSWPLSEDDVGHALSELEAGHLRRDYVAHPDDSRCADLHSLWAGYFAERDLPRRAPLWSPLAARLGLPERHLRRLRQRDPEQRCAGWELWRLHERTDLFSQGTSTLEDQCAAAPGLAEFARGLTCEEARHQAYLGLFNLGLACGADYSTLVDRARAAWRACDEWQRHACARSLAWILPIELPHLEGHRDAATLAAYRAGARELNEHQRAFLEQLASFHGGCLPGADVPRPQSGEQ